jgi:hypothetical protein
MLPFWLTTGEPSLKIISPPENTARAAHLPGTHVGSKPSIRNGFGGVDSSTRDNGER